MRAVVLLGVLAVLSGCADKPEIKQCEDYIKGKLRSPSTYKRIKAEGVAVPFEKPTKYTVSVEYDAANAYGTPVRDTQLCIYPIRDGKPVADHYIDFDAGLSATADMIEEQADNLEAAADAEIANLAH